MYRLSTAYTTESAEKLLALDAAGLKNPEKNDRLDGLEALETPLVHLRTKRPQVRVLLGALENKPFRERGLVFVSPVQQKYSNQPVPDTACCSTGK